MPSSPEEGHVDDPAKAGPLAWALAIGVVAVLVIGVAVAFGLRQPDNEQPSGGLAVEVLDHGSRVRIAVTHCPGLHVTDVSIVAEHAASQGVQTHESSLWSARPTGARQWLFDTGSAGGSFAGVTSTSHVTYYAEVGYDASTAPRKFQRDSNISLEIDLSPSRRQQAAFDRLSAQRC